MALQIFGFNGRSGNFAVTEANVPLGQWPFLLDFAAH